MVTMKQIREDLKEIKYYYSKKKIFEESFKTVVSSSVLEKVKLYNDAMQYAPIKLYDLYISLYVKNYTQIGLSLEWNYSKDYIKQLNQQLCLYIFKYLNLTAD